MKPTKRQLRKAARLWILSLAYQTGTSGANSDDETAMRAVAEEMAAREIERMGHKTNDLCSDVACITAAMRPNEKVEAKDAGGGRSPLTEG